MWGPAIEAMKADMASLKVIETRLCDIKLIHLHSGAESVSSITSSYKIMKYIDGTAEIHIVLEV